MSNRETQFAGFAKKLLSEMVELHGYIDISGFWNSPDDETVQEYTHIIAQRAYDFATHVYEHTLGAITRDPELGLRNVPDLTQWPEEAK